MTPVRLLLSPAAAGAENMALDEAILESVDNGNSAPTLRLYAWDPPCLSIGYAQSVADVDLPRLLAAGWDLVRRPTGGKAILHTDELTYAIIGRPQDPLFAGGVLPSYERLSGGLVTALTAFGVDPQVHGGASENGNNPICFQTPGQHELTVDGKKLIGSAQLRRVGGVLQHGSLPLQGDLSRICRVLRFEHPRDRSRAAEAIREKATTLAQAVGRSIGWQEAADGLAAGFAAALGLSLQAGDLTSAERERAAELRESRYSQNTWNERR